MNQPPKNYQTNPKKKRYITNVHPSDIFGNMKTSLIDCPEIAFWYSVSPGMIVRNSWSLGSFSDYPQPGGNCTIAVRVAYPFLLVVGVPSYMWTPF